MCRPFIVERESGSFMSDPREACAKLYILKGLRCLRWCSAKGAIHRRQHILRECVQDIGQNQFLMLFLVIEAEHGQRHCLVRRIGFQHTQHRLIDVIAVTLDVFA